MSFLEADRELAVRERQRVSRYTTIMVNLIVSLVVPAALGSFFPPVVVVWVGISLAIAPSLPFFILALAGVYLLFSLLIWLGIWYVSRR